MAERIPQRHFAAPQGFAQVMKLRVAEDAEVLERQSTRTKKEIVIPGREQCAQQQEESTKLEESRPRGLR